MQVPGSCRGETEQLQKQMPRTAGQKTSFFGKLPGGNATGIAGKKRQALGKNCRWLLLPHQLFPGLLRQCEESPVGPVDVVPAIPPLGYEADLKVLFLTNISSPLHCFVRNDLYLLEWIHRPRPRRPRRGHHHEGKETPGAVLGHLLPEIIALALKKN